MRVYYEESLEKRLKASYFIQDKDSSCIHGKYTAYAISGSCVQEGGFENGLKEGFFTTYHPNGTLATIVQYRGGLCQGQARSYGANGRLEQTSHFLHDQLHGQVRRYRSDGTLWRVAFFVENVPQGTIKEYYTSGQLEKELQQLDGKPHGVVRHFYENGQLKSQEEYKNGYLWGKSTRYYEDGQLYQKVGYARALQEGEMLRYHPNGQLSYKGGFREGVADGALAEYDEQGQLIQETKYINPYLRLSTRYRSDGTRMEEYSFSKKERLHTHIFYDTTELRTRVRHYKDKIPTKIWETYYPKVSKRVVEKYKKGRVSWRAIYFHEKLHCKRTFPLNGRGTEKCYYVNGQKSSVAHYLRQVKNGAYLRYHPNGQTELKGRYKYGFPIGKWYYYDQNGKVLRTEEHGAKYGR